MFVSDSQIFDFFGLAISITVDYDTCFVILLSFIAIMSIFLVQTQEMLKVIKILLRQHAFIWNRDSNLFLQGTLMLRLLVS